MFLAIAVIVVAYLFNDTIMNADRYKGSNEMFWYASFLEEAEYDGKKSASVREGRKRNRKSVTSENLKKQIYDSNILLGIKTNIQFCGDDICTIVLDVCHAKRREKVP